MNRLEDFSLGKLEMVNGPDGPELHGWFGGVECRLEAKPSWLRSGFAACNPVDDSLGLDWPMAVRVEDHATGAVVLIDNATADPRVINALADGAF